MLDDPEGWGRLNLFAAADGYGAFTGNVVVTMLGISWFLGQRKSRPAKNYPYESGIVSVGSAHFRIGIAVA